MKMKRADKSGFTLVEMLVVIGIIGVLAGALVGSVGHLKRSAKRAKAQNMVSDAYTALNLYLQKERDWHPRMINALEMDELVCEKLVQQQLIDMKVDIGKSNSTSLDRFGLLDEWGRDALRRNPLISASTQTGFDGIRIEDRRIQFRLDQNLDGYVDATEGAPNGLRVRSSVVVWSRGPDGQDDFESSNPKAKNRYPYDDLISWNQSQVNADQ